MVDVGYEQNITRYIGVENINWIDSYKLIREDIHNENSFTSNVLCRYKFRNF